MKELRQFEVTSAINIISRRETDCRQAGHTASLSQRKPVGTAGRITQSWTWIGCIHGLDRIGWDDCDPFLIGNYCSTVSYKL